MNALIADDLFFSIFLTPVLIALVIVIALILIILIPLLKGCNSDGKVVGVVVLKKKSWW